MTADTAGPTVPERGTWVDRFEIIAIASRGRHAALLQARDRDGSFVALKLATSGVGAQLAEHEERVLGALGGGSAGIPRVLLGGMHGGHRWCASTWMRGIHIREVAAELRAEGSAAGLVAVCGRVARQFAALHAEGIVHGQVHPRHVLVDGDGSIALIDFSVATSRSECPAPARLEARFGSLGAPEQAESLLRGDEVVSTASAEQFSVGALLYLLVTGRMYARLRLERDTLPRDIVRASPLPFSEYGLEPSPELESVLRRALERDPGKRYPSLGDLAEALDAVADRIDAPMRMGRRSPGLDGALEAFRCEAYDDDAIARLVAPTCSINLGAAGVAFALTRLGTLTGDVTAYAQAERWLEAAEQRALSADAFDDGDQLVPQTIGRISPFHTASGVATARAFLSRATGDQAREQEALDSFLAATSAPCSNLDLTLGRSSVLLVAALLLAGSNRTWPQVLRLVVRGDEFCTAIWHEAADSQMAYHGIAHGPAGLAYASMMWCRARGVAPVPEVHGTLERLAGLAEPWQRGARWPVSPTTGSSPVRYWPGWCHGSAGYVFLWNLAEATYGEPRFAMLAERAAWLLDSPAGVTSLCCGTAGQAYAALAQYRRTGRARWLDLAVRLAERGATSDALAGDASTPLSLYKGHVGLALLALDLEHPERAAMPLFESESIQT